MYLFRWLILLALLISAAFFFGFAITGQTKYKKIGLFSLKLTLGVAFLFFAVLIFERL